MKASLTPEDLIGMLNLEPLPGEGGFFRQTFLAETSVLRADGARRRALSSIYYLITPESFSALHKLPSDEAFHFYMGDPVEMIQLSPAGELRTVVLGSDLRAGESLQTVVPAHWWQGARLKAGGRWALLGTNIGPGFEFADLVVATAADLENLPTEGAVVKLRAYLAPPAPPQT